MIDNVIQILPMLLHIQFIGQVFPDPFRYDFACERILTSAKHE